nr:hypothetical protein [Tanacetum cinerariifolium]
EEADEEHRTDAVIGDSDAVGLGEEPRGLAFEREAEETAGCAVHVRVSGREGRGEDEGVYDMREDADAESVHRDDVGRRCCAG